MEGPLRRTYFQHRVRVARRALEGDDVRLLPHQLPTACLSARAHRPAINRPINRPIKPPFRRDKPAGENMDAPNLYGVLTIIAFTLSLPFALYFEGAGFMEAWKASTAVVGAPWLIRQMALDGFYYYTYNEVRFCAARFGAVCAARR